MGIIPESDEPKEPLGVLAVLIVHYILGLGIALIGQRTKNVGEFWAGVIVFFIAVSVIVATVYGAGGDALLLAYGLFSLATWLYILGRLAWIYVKKETRLTII